METQRVGRYLDRTKLENKLKSKFGNLNFNITVRPVNISYRNGLSTDFTSDHTQCYDLRSARRKETKRGEANKVV